MSLGTFIICGISFAAGVVFGVIIGDKGIVTSDNLGQGGRYIVDSTRSAVSKMKKKNDTQEPPVAE